MKIARLILACFAVTAIFASSLCPLNAADQPNIVFILIDDMPWFGTRVRMDADMPEPQGNIRFPSIGGRG